MSRTPGYLTATLRIVQSYHRPANSRQREGERAVSVSPASLQEHSSESEEEGESRMDQLDNAVIVAAEEVESEGSCPGQLSRSPSPGQGREAGRVSRSPSPGRKDSRGSHGSSSYDEERASSLSPEPPKAALKYLVIGQLVIKLKCNSPSVELTKNDMIHDQRPPGDRQAWQQGHLPDVSLTDGEGGRGDADLHGQPGDRQRGGGGGQADQAQGEAQHRHHTDIHTGNTTNSVC